MELSATSLSFEFSGGSSPPYPLSPEGATPVLRTAQRNSAEWLPCSPEGTPCPPETVDDNVREAIQIFGYLIKKKCRLLAQSCRKREGLKKHIERFNNTMRQKISRLVRKTLSFSKKLDNHIGAIWYFLHHYNASLSA